MLIITFLFTCILGSSSTKAFAMSSKGSSKIAFHTDANNYSKSATTIDVTGTNPFDALVVELYKKGDSKFYKRIDVYKYGTYKVSFSLKGLKSGQYDVHVNSSWSYLSFHAELTNYLNVQR
ncbi:hypothetical protein HCC18_03485 [Listeria booriae]|uniref:Uncharacterized protein n=1 Tax=Listeria booriae TaxID=1552123 RepID=A0A7X1CH10_9LIST|nr:hypothetical protein [Listeria booriae]MBC2023521.1 hypothetical protein [Listeria booriae]MBC2315896.1 hypothetical protein [Listeria booriae]